MWFAEPSISATKDEVRRLIQKAKAWAESLGTPVGLWMSDKQDAFVTGIAAVFPDVPHRYCDNHFLRDVAKPVLEADRTASTMPWHSPRPMWGLPSAPGRTWPSNRRR